MIYQRQSMHHVRDRDLAAMPTAPLDTIRGFYAPAWAVGSLLGFAAAVAIILIHKFLGVIL